MDSDGSEPHNLPNDLSFGFGALNDIDIMSPFSEKENDPKHYKPANLQSKINKLIDDIERENAPISPKRPMKSVKAAFRSARSTISLSSANRSYENRTSRRPFPPAEEDLEKKFEIPKGFDETETYRKMAVCFGTVFVFFALVLTLSLALTNSGGSTPRAPPPAAMEIPSLKGDEFLIASGSDYLFGNKDSDFMFQVSDPSGSDVKFLIGCSTVPITCLTVVFESGFSRTIGNCFECQESSFLTFQNDSIVAAKVHLLDEELMGFKFECTQSEFDSGGGSSYFRELDMNSFSGEKVLRGIYGHLSPSDEILSIGFIFSRTEY